MPDPRPFETKCFISPSYVLEHRGRRLALSDRQGLVVARLFAAGGRWVSAVSLSNMVYQDEQRTAGRSNYHHALVEPTIGDIAILLEGWPLSIDRQAGIRYRLVERRPKHRASIR